LLSAYASVSNAFGPGNIRDISTGDETAQIIIPNAHGCSISLPVRAHVLTLNAGSVFIVQTCTKPASLLNQLTGGDLGFGRKSQTFTRTHYFNAKPGHTYELEGECFRSSNDDSAVAEVVSCAPLLPGRAMINGNKWTLKDNCTEEYALRKQMDPLVRSRADASKKVPFSKFWKEYCVPDPIKPVTTTISRIIPGGAISQRNACWPSAESKRSKDRVALMGVTAGPTQLDASCMKPQSNTDVGVKTASFSFDAEPGHIYALSGEDETCMRLLDITSEEVVVACEAYHQATTE
jgi:hypothetical protein